MVYECTWLSLLLGSTIFKVIPVEVFGKIWKINVFLLSQNYHNLCLLAMIGYSSHYTLPVLANISGDHWARETCPQALLHHKDPPWIHCSFGECGFYCSIPMQEISAALLLITGEWFSDMFSWGPAYPIIFSSFAVGKTTDDNKWEKKNSLLSHLPHYCNYLRSLVTVCTNRSDCWGN